MGMVMATSGLTPELFAVFESITAQRQLGFCSIFFTRSQQVPDGVALSLFAADKHGSSFTASESGEFFPHTLAASAAVILATATRKRTHVNFNIGDSICSIVCGKAWDL